ncbi:MAG: LacI family transcriptional regulator, partial [Christensenellaceae bacterium]|nr:LacI family transcriptional regulator [Christensenellaceae bacterium]
MKVVTIHDVAKMAGVGISTVSRVINNRHDVGDKTRKKVWEAIDKLGYVRNDSASNLKLKHQVSVAVIVSGRHNVFLTEIAEQIINLGHETEYDFLLEFIDEKDDEFFALKRLYLRKKLSAAIFLGSDLDKHLEDIQNFNLPCIFSTISVPEAEGLKTSSVSVDNELYGYKSIEKLISLNHKKIALAGYLSADDSLDYTGKRLKS